MSLFASHELARALAAVENVQTRCTTLACGGLSIPAIVINGEPLIDRVWLDYLEPAPGTPELTVRYLPRVVRGLIPQEGWEDARSGADRIQAAPLIDWTQFANWDDANTWFCRKRSNHNRNLDRIRRKTEREHGTISFNPFDTDETAFDDLVLWKRLHFARTGVGDPLAHRSNLALFRELFISKALHLATIRSGGQVMAAILYARQNGRLSYWMVSYNTDLRQYAPGTLLLQDLLADSFALGDHEFDFMLGDEDYKWQFATHTRLIGELGTVPVSRMARRWAGQTKRRLQATSVGRTAPDS